MPARRPTVVVVGSVNVDLTLRLPSLPRPGETVAGATRLRSLGGKGANQAAAAARLGARTFLIGRRGADADGEFATAGLAAHRVDTGYLGIDPDQPTGLATVLTDLDGQNLIAVASGANAGLTATEVGLALDAMESGPAVLVANLEVPIETVLAAGTAARRRGWPFVLNPAPARPLPAELLSLVDVLTPNEHEVTVLNLDAGHGFGGTLIVTRGAAGLNLIENGRPAQRIPAFEVDGLDSTGAGDAGTGALAWALAAGHDLPRAAVFAAAAGALATRAVGAQSSLATPAELAQLVQRGQRL